MYLMAEVYVRKRLKIILKEVCKKLAGGRSKFRPIIAHTHKIKLIYDNYYICSLGGYWKGKGFKIARDVNLPHFINAKMADSSP